MFTGILGSRVSELILSFKLFCSLLCFPVILYSQNESDQKNEKDEGCQAYEKYDHEALVFPEYQVEYECKCSDSKDA